VIRTRRPIDEPVRRGDRCAIAVVQGFVRDYGGAVDIASEPGQGATFQILLPAGPEKPLGVQSPVTSSKGEQSIARLGTILVVEDEQLLRHCVSLALRKKGFSVVDATEGSTAMDLIRARADDLDAVLLDVTLPGMSSREILEQAGRIRPGLKVILTSAYSKEFVSPSFVGLPVDCFIRKPFQLAHLVRLLQDALSA